MGVDGVLPPDANQSPRNSGGRAQRPVIFFQISLVDCNVKLRVRTVVPQESILVFQITFFFFNVEWKQKCCIGLWKASLQVLFSSMALDTYLFGLLFTFKMNFFQRCWENEQKYYISLLELPWQSSVDWEGLNNRILFSQHSSRG